MQTQPIQFDLGLQVIQSYKRLSYTPWHAIAELVDNATQSYFDNRDVIDKAFSQSTDTPCVGVVYDQKSEVLRVSDNSMGMSHDELTNALRVGFPPRNTSGRSKYGMGMKTASCWIGNHWTVRTKKFGETQEHLVTVDVNRVAAGDSDLRYHASEGKPKEEHYTVIEITRHNQVFRGRTLGKIKDFLRSIYREDLRSKLVTIEWQGTPLEWRDSDFEFLQAPDGSSYRKDFKFNVSNGEVKGWVGVLSRGGRSDAGFSILHAGRVVRGWPESWRPEEIYGFQGRNDLINQRLVGEIHLDGFEVSHTKDDILWYGGQQEEVERLLKEECADYVEVARRYRKGGARTGPSELDVQAAVIELEDELSSEGLSDLLKLLEVPPPEVVTQVLQPLKLTANDREPDFKANLEGLDLELFGFLMTDVSPNDPYVVVESTNSLRIQIIVNRQHPHWSQLSGSEGVLNYLRHCTYDGIAEWQARRKSASLDPDTIKVLKDRLLRFSLEII